MRLAPLTCLLALGCATSPSAPQLGPAVQPEPASQLEPAMAIECGRYGYAGLYTAVSQRNGSSTAPSFDTAQAAADRDVEAAGVATAAHDDRAAAGHYLACAKRFSEVPGSDPLHATARRNAMLCYQNARWAHANAGLWASEGKAMLTAAAHDDPRHASELERLIAEPVSECKN